MEIYMPAEMLEAGLEALRESRASRMDEEQQVLHVYLAMQGVAEFIRLRGETEFLH